MKNGLTLVWLLIFFLWTPQAGTAIGEPVPLCGQSGCPQVAGGEGALRLDNTRSVSDNVPNRGTPATHGDAPGRREWLTVEEYLAPTCAGNTLNGSVELCDAALTSCPADDQVRWWVWHRETQHSRDDAGVVTSVPGEWAQEPGSFCLGADDPGVPTIGRVISQVQAAFQDLPLPVPALQVDPAPATLVNIPTAFFAGGERAATFSPTILGAGVRIEATASRWDWSWGDGTTSSTDSPGVPKRPVVAHEYVQARDHEVGVVTTWTGTFTVAGSDEVFVIRTPAVVSGPPVTVQVREARTELVAG